MNDDKFELMIDIPKIVVVSKLPEDDIMAKQLETSLNCKYNEVLNEFVKRIKQDIHLG